MVSLDNEVAIGIPDDEIGIVAGSEAALSGPGGELAATTNLASFSASAS